MSAKEWPEFRGPEAQGVVEAEDAAADVGQAADDAAAETEAAAEDAGASLDGTMRAVLNSGMLSEDRSVDLAHVVSQI